MINAPALVAFGEKRKQDLHLVAALLDVPDVVEDDGVVGIERGEILLEAKVAFRSEQSLDERERRGEEDAVAALDQLVADGAHQVGLPSTRQSERKNVVAALDEAPS